MANQSESLRSTLFITVTISLVCAVLVTSATILLKPRQLAWTAIDQNRAIITAAGLAQTPTNLSPGEVVALMGSLSASLLEINSTEVITGPQALTFNFFSAADHESEAYQIPSNLDSAGLSKRPTFAPIYMLNSDGKLERLVLPFYGPGMWSRISGYIALEADLNTIAEIVIYQHGETPGIGDQIEQLDWRTHWHGKQLRDGTGRLRFGVSTASTEPDTQKYQIDAISGATITSNSVIASVTYWFGDNGYGPYLHRLREASE